MISRLHNRAVLLPAALVMAAVILVCVPPVPSNDPRAVDYTMNFELRDTVGLTIGDTVHVSVVLYPAFVVDSLSVRIVQPCGGGAALNTAYATEFTHDSLVADLPLTCTGTVWVRADVWLDNRTMHSDSVRLTVGDSAHVPTLHWKRDTLALTGAEDETIDYVLRDSLNYTGTASLSYALLPGLPDSDAVISTSALYRFTPSYTDSGTYNARVRVTDGVLSDTVTLRVHIVDRLPVGNRDSLIAFSFANPAVTGIIDEAAKTVTVSVPFGTNVTALVATFAAPGASVKVGSAVQTSGATANNFTSPVTYTVTAADGSTQDYAVTVTVDPSPAKAMASFSIVSPAVTGTIDETAKTVALTVPYGTSVTALIAAFAATGASVKVGSTAQTSGTTTNNFTSPVTYTVTAADGSTQNYVVTVTVASNSAKALTAFSFAGLGVTGTISETAKTVALTVPYATTVTALVATFAATGASVKVGSAVQTSATTPNNFTSPVTYTVTAADGSTQDYVVTVTVALNSAKALTAFSFAGLGVTGTVNEAAKTVAAAVPYGTNVTALVATFSATGASVKVGSAVQTSATTPNNFTSPVTYTVTGADGSTQDYVVTVTVGPSPAKALTSFGIVSPAVTGTIDETAKTVALTVPYATTVTALVATFSATGASVKVGSAVQTSAATPNNFTSPVTYTVTAADGSTQDYVVTVTIAPPTTFTVSFDSRGGTAVASQTVTHGNTPTMPASPTRTGYVFDGWYDQTLTIAFDFSAPVTASKTAYAKWTARSYTVTLAKEGGSGGSNSVSVTLGSAMPPANVPTRTGYSFEGYFSLRSGGVQYYTVSMSSARSWDSDNLDTLYARWTPRTFAIAFDRRSGTLGTGTATATFDASMPNASAPSRPGYDFAGYFDAISGGTQYYTSTMASSRNWDKVTDATLYAHWNPIVYTIDYRMNSGINNPGNPASYTIESAITFSNPTRTDFDFVAWYSDSLFATSTVTQIPLGTTGNKTFYAKWRWGVTLTDIDGNVYATVLIGSQVWTVENLKTTKYRDGTPIAKDTSTANWWTFPASADSGKYCWYNNDEAANKNPYGALYNWYVVKPTNSKKIAPAGWHVPTDSEWTVLSTYLGGESVAGGKMKEAGTTHWSSPNTGATNSSGFSALPGGGRFEMGRIFGLQSDYGGCWSATERDVASAYDRSLDYDYENLGRTNYDKSCGFSVRLLRD